LAITYINIVEKQVKRMINEIPTLVNGSGLRRLYAGNAKAKVKEIRSATLTADEITKEYKELNKDDVRLLYVGVLKSEKGVNYLIEGFKLLIDQGYNVRLTIVGDGPEKTRLERMAMEMEIDKEISFKGYIPLGPQLFEIYKRNDIFILPSISEGTPRVLIEAMANRLLVIATNVGGVPFTINNNKNGILIEPKSPDQICCAVKEILKNDEKREQIIEEAFEFAKENTLESFVDNICNAFEV
jgi:glycosyltransferase involved in cell wall biosynthesis